MKTFVQSARLQPLGRRLQAIFSVLCWCRIVWFSTFSLLPLIKILFKHDAQFVSHRDITAVFYPFPR